ncbi:MFS transporter [Silvibacterium dinghuense]|uniref:MFS transporter n=1 Tax=Silvibacterium dinghuense TaxID=1560006 RepID=A0A4Q1SDB4_9BACT|nr:MFS transporter [Silvibacterium dinghuense]RXS95219.1 MFS transporter [Silvibacterium dinghuense]GGH11613.1 putative transporter YybO [Silvibacterium dinghuense]
MPIAEELTSEYSSSEPYRWTIGLLLGFGVLVNYFDRVNLSVSHDALVESFHITPAVFGQLSAAYSWTYAACQLPTGVVLDKFGVRKVSLISTAIWGIASIAAAFAPGLVVFFAARLLLGIGEAPTFPASAKAVGAWFPTGERSFATAIFDSTAKLANAIGVPLLGLLLLRVGWRWSFGFTGLLSFGYLAVFALLYRERSRFFPHKIIRDERGADDVGAMLAPPVPLSRLLRQRKVIGAAIGSGAYNYVFYLLLTWLPTYLAQTQHITLRQSFLYTGAPWLVATLCGLLIGGVLVDLLIKRGLDASAVRRTVLIGGMCCGLGIAGAAFAHSVISALIPITIAISGLAAASPVLWSLPSLLVPNSSAGKVGGIMNFSNQLSAIAAPILTGWMVQLTHRYVLAFVIPTVYILMGLVAYGTMLGRIEPVKIDATPAGNAF